MSSLDKRMTFIINFGHLIYWNEVSYCGWIAPTYSRVSYFCSINTSITSKMQNLPYTQKHRYLVHKSTTVHCMWAMKFNKNHTPPKNHQSSQNSVEKNMKIICKKPQVCGHKAWAFDMKFHVTLLSWQLNAL